MEDGGIVDMWKRDNYGVKFCNYRLPGPCKSRLSPGAKNPPWQRVTSGVNSAEFLIYGSPRKSCLSPLEKKSPRKIRLPRTDVARKPPSLDLVE